MDVLNDLNTRVHNQAKQFLIKQETCPFEHNTVKIEEFIDEVDPVLWETICLLTRSKTERREKTKHATCSKSQSNPGKRICRFFLLYMILFNAGDRCSLPLHTLLTDMIDSQGGTALLVKILNRLGICASADTLSRFIQYKSMFS